jgi:hypothetical protein
MGVLALRRTKATPNFSGRPLVHLPGKTTVLLQASWGSARSSRQGWASVNCSSHHWHLRAWTGPVPKPS